MIDIAGPAQITRPPGLSLQQSLLIAVIGFLTLVDLFATQAILPSLAEIYGVAPARIGLAANASTLGMAISGLAMGVVSARLERKRAIAFSLFCLSFPTALLAFAPDLSVFAILRVVQGLFMAAAFTLTLAHLAERCAVRTATIPIRGYPPEAPRPAPDACSAGPERVRRVCRSKAKSPW